MNLSELQRLKNELAVDPLSIGYAACFPDSPGAVVDLINAKTQMMVKEITCAQGMGWAAAGPYAAIVDASENVAHPCRASCLVLRELFSAGLPIHLEDPHVMGMFGAWVATGLITQAEQDALIVTATQPASRAEVLGLPVITEAAIRAALEA